MEEWSVWCSQASEIKKDDVLFIKGLEPHLFDKMTSILPLMDLISCEFCPKALKAFSSLFLDKSVKWWRCVEWGCCALTSSWYFGSQMSLVQARTENSEGRLGGVELLESSTRQMCVVENLSRPDQWGLIPNGGSVRIYTSAIVLELFSCRTNARVKTPNVWSWSTLVRHLLFLKKS